MYKELLYKVNPKTIAKIGCLFIISAITIQLIQHRFISFVFNLLLCTTFQAIFRYLNYKNPKKDNNFLKAFMISIYLFSIIGLFIWPNSPSVFLIVLLVTPLLANNFMNMDSHKFVAITTASIIGLIIYKIAIYTNYVNLPTLAKTTKSQEIISTIFDYSVILVLLMTIFVYVKNLLLDSQELKKVINPQANHAKVQNKNRRRSDTKPNGKKNSNYSIEELTALMNFSLTHIKKNIQDKELLQNINNLLNIKNQKQLKIFLSKDLKKLSAQLTKALSPNTNLKITVTKPFVDLISRKQFFNLHKIINHLIIEIIINSAKYSNHAEIILSLLNNKQIQIYVIANPKTNTKTLLKNHSIYTTLKIMIERINFIFKQNIAQLQIKHQDTYNLKIVFDLQKIKLKDKVLSQVL